MGSLKSLYLNTSERFCFGQHFSLKNPVDMLQEGGPLPGPKTGLLSNTQK